MFDDKDLIFSYSRNEALADGVLVDVTEIAKEAGILLRVALTAAVHGRCVIVPEGVTGQHPDGRIWDIVWMLRHAGRRARWEASTILFCVLVRNDETEPKPVELKAICGPDDDGTPCITVMFPDED